jgi:hypothetical protein
MIGLTLSYLQTVILKAMNFKDSNTFLRIHALILLVFVLLTIAFKPDEAAVTNFKRKAGFTCDTVSLLRNPLTGWAIYATAGTPIDYWEKFDHMAVPALNRIVKTSDYATILYIRMGWADFEPTEGNYAWNNEGLLKMLIDGAAQRHLKLAFRVNVDSRDKSTQCTPAYVKDAGANGFISKTGRKMFWSPYPDDPIFQHKYEKFIKAFANRFNNADEVDLVDGYGLGKWGESHSVRYLNEANREPVFNWITNLYLRYFTKVPLALNYHRLIGTPKEWGPADKDSQRLLASAFKKGFILRHDAFGMTDYYKDFEKSMPAQWFPERPVIAEGGWLHNGQNGYLKDSRKYKNWQETWKGEYDDAMEAHVNIMDLRGYADATSWFETSFPLIEKFIGIGGYRFYPSVVVAPGALRIGKSFVIKHTWQNIGIGMCPTNLPQWNQKYKVAFALLDKVSLKSKQVFVDGQTDLSTWLKGKASSYRYVLPDNQLPAGRYVLAIAIVNTTKHDKPEIKLAVKERTTQEGWLPVQDVSLR